MINNDQFYFSHTHFYLTWPICLLKSTALFRSTVYFSLLSYCPAPFLILDEVDAALDNSNIGKVRFLTFSELIVWKMT